MSDKLPGLLELPPNRVRGIITAAGRSMRWKANLCPSLVIALRIGFAL